MESTGHVSVPLRTGKKMKKRKELDALVANSVTKRSCVASKRGQAGGGISSQDQLLSESTDDQEYWVAGAAKRPRTRLARRRACGSLFRACTAILMFACVIATTTVLWLFIDIREQITALRSELDQVVASSQGVPDALQKCHTISKSLQQNQTLITSQIVTIKLQLENFTKELSDMHTGLEKIQEKLNNVPDYLNVPQQLKEVSSSIANLGSQIKDITTTVDSLKNSKDKLETASNTLLQNVTDLRQSVMHIQDTTQVPVAVNTENNVEIQNMLKVIDGIKNNITTINSTLSNNVMWVKDDLKKSNKNIESNSNLAQNMSARVTTLEGICSKTSSDQIILSTNLKSVSDQFSVLTTKVQSHSSQISDLQSQVRELSQNSSELSSAISILNHSLGQMETKAYTHAEPESVHVRDLDKTKTDPPPSSSVQPQTVLPTQSTGSTAKENNPTGKPAILTT